MKNLYSTIKYGWKYDRKGFWNFVMNSMIVIFCVCYIVFILKVI